jgi:hypothetical protein
MPDRRPASVHSITSYGFGEAASHPLARHRHARDEEGEEEEVSDGRHVITHPSSARPTVVVAGGEPPSHDGGADGIDVVVRRRRRESR